MKNLKQIIIATLVIGVVMINSNSLICNAMEVKAENSTEDTNSASDYTEKAKFYYELYGPKEEKCVIVVIDDKEYSIPYMPGAPTDVYIKIAENIVKSEKAIAEAEKTTYTEKAVVTIDSVDEVIEEPTEEDVDEPETNYTPSSGGCLTAYAGVYNGPSGKETYYNLDMSGVISIMRSMGYGEEEYPYWVREDGVKMFGPYVMVAAELSSRPKGTILECSLGTAMVVDTGGFASGNPTQLDIATTW